MEIEGPDSPKDFIGEQEVIPPKIFSTHIQRLIINVMLSLVIGGLVGYYQAMTENKRRMENIEKLTVENQQKQKKLEDLSRAFRALELLK